MTRLLSRFLRALVWLPLAGVALIIGAAHVSPSIRFLTAARGAAWIALPTTAANKAQMADWVGPPTAVFRLRFTARPPLKAATLHAMALCQGAVFLNGTRRVLGSCDRWRDEIEADVSDLIVAGPNELRAVVQNPTGPPLLRLSLSGLDAPVATNASWEVALGTGAFTAAVVADETRLALAGETPAGPLGAVRRRPLALLALCLLALSLLFAPPPRPAAALLLAHAYWLYLFVVKFRTIPLDMGFDASDHLQYIRHLLATGSIPLAWEGWKFDQPPFFYWLASLPLRLFSGLLGGRPQAAILLVKAVPFLSGLGQIWLAAGLGKILFKRDPAARSCCILAAGFLPMNIYMSAYASNEPLHSFLAGAAILLTVRILDRPRSEARHLLGLGLCLGLALLTKFTALIIVPVAFFHVFAKLVLVERASARRTAGLTALGLFSLLVACGWYFSLNYIRMGTPILVNFGDIPGHEWWQQPGFHTWRYFLGFGEALRQPYFSSLHSFSDSLYSTFWGDGLLAGVPEYADRIPQWDYDLMSLVYWLALPASLLLAGGGILAAGRAATPAYGFFVTLFWAFGSAILYSTLRYPHSAQAKAYLALAMTAPLSVLAALGFGACRRFLERKSALAERLFMFWAALLLSAIALSFAG